MEQEPKVEKVQEYHEVIINALIEAKRKEEKTEKSVMKIGILLLSILILGCIYILHKATVGFDNGSYLSFILSDFLILGWIAVLLISYKIFETKSKKFEKAEKDFDELKEDIIDRSSDIWYSTQLEEKRMIQYHELKNKYDINLYHK